MNNGRIHGWANERKEKRKGEKKKNVRIVKKRRKGSKETGKRNTREREKKGKKERKKGIEK